MQDFSQTDVIPVTEPITSKH